MPFLLSNKWFYLSPTSWDVNLWNLFNFRPKYILGFTLLSPLFINIPVAPLSRSTFMVTPSCISNFSTLIFNHTSLSILKVLLTSFWLSSSFAVLSRSLAHVLLCCTFASLSHTAFSTLFSLHPYQFNTSNLFLEITPCSLLSSTWHTLLPHLSQVRYKTTTSFVHHSNSSRYTSSSTPLSQCSFALFLNSTTELLLYSYCTFCSIAACAASPPSTLLNLCCCVFCGIAIRATFSTSLFLFSYSRHSLHLCPFSLHLKYSITITSCLLIIASSTPHYITLLFDTSNLFWGTIVPFSSSFLLL